MCIHNYQTVRKKRDCVASPCMIIKYKASNGVVHLHFKKQQLCWDSLFTFPDFFSICHPQGVPIIILNISGVGDWRVLG